MREGEIAMSRTPQPQMLPVKPHIRSNGDINNPKHSTDDLYLNRTRRNDDDFQNVEAEHDTHNEDDTTTDLSNNSLVPKQVSEIYKKPVNESVALERKSSVKKIQQQQLKLLENCNNSKST